MRLKDPRARRILFATVAVVFVGVLILLFLKHRNRIVVQVGDYAITSQDIRYRNQIQAINYPNDPNDYGRDQLVKTFTAAQILKNNGFEITERTLREEERRIDQMTKDPKTLNQIKAVFGKDHEAYKRIFVLSMYAERAIFDDLFLKNPKVQSQVLIKAHEFSESVKKNPADWKKRCQELGLIIRKLFVSREIGVVWAPIVEPTSAAQLETFEPKKAEGSQKQPHVENENRKLAQSWIDNVISRLKPGQIFQEPIDQGDSWVVVKYIKATPGHQHLLEAVVFPKLQYSDWLQNEKGKVQISDVGFW